MNDETKEPFDAAEFRRQEDAANRMTFLVKIPVGVVIILALAAVINHWLVSELGQADGDLISLFVVLFGLPALAGLWMAVTGQV